MACEARCTSTNKSDCFRPWAMMATPPSRFCLLPTNVSPVPGLQFLSGPSPFLPQSLCTSCSFCLEWSSHEQLLIFQALVEASPLHLSSDHSIQRGHLSIFCLRTLLSASYHLELLLVICFLGFVSAHLGGMVEDSRAAIYMTQGCCGHGTCMWFLMEWTKLKDHWRVQPFLVFPRDAVVPHFNHLSLLVFF